MSRPSRVVRGLVALLWLYQRTLSPWLSRGGPRCRFHPSCSAYAIGALEKGGALKGGFRAAWRLLRCHPLNPGGFDPP